jgi:hypothetical protein
MIKIGWQSHLWVLVILTYPTHAAFHSVNLFISVFLKFYLQYIFLTWYRKVNQLIILSVSKYDVSFLHGRSCLFYSVIITIIIIRVSNSYSFISFSLLTVSLRMVSIIIKRKKEKCISFHFTVNRPIAGCCQSVPWKPQPTRFRLQWSMSKHSAHVAEILFKCRCILFTCKMLEPGYMNV